MEGGEKPRCDLLHASNCLYLLQKDPNHRYPTSGLEITSSSVTSGRAVKDSAQIQAPTVPLPRSQDPKNISLLSVLFPL